MRLSALRFRCHKLKFAHCCDVLSPFRFLKRQSLNVIMLSSIIWRGNILIEYANIYTLIIQKTRAFKVIYARFSSEVDLRKNRKPCLYKIKNERSQSPCIILFTYTLYIIHCADFLHSRCNNKLLIITIVVFVVTIIIITVVVVVIVVVVVVVVVVTR